MDRVPAFTIAFAEGVTLTKWTTAWAERQPETALAFLPGGGIPQLRDNSATVAFVRLAEGETLPDDLSVIPLYTETPMVVVPKDHAVTTVESVTLADLNVEDRVSDAATPADRVELVAAGAGIALMPQSLARLHDRKDVEARPVTDAAATSIALVWIAAQPAAGAAPLIDEFVGIVRGRTARSSRGAAAADDPSAEKPGKKRAAKGPASAARKVRPITGRTRPRKPRGR